MSNSCISDQKSLDFGSLSKDGNCAGTGGVYRVDRADDLDWLYGTFGDHLP